MDAFDIMAFAVFAVLIAAAFVVIVGLGTLPGRIARSRGHPQAAAINASSWLGLATGGILWLLAMVWAFTEPAGAKVAPVEEASSADGKAATTLPQIQARIEALEAVIRELQTRSPAAGGS